MIFIIMYRRLSISLCKLPIGNHFGRFPSFSNTLTTLSEQCSYTRSRNFYQPSSTKWPTRFKICHFREYSVDADKEVDKINRKFAEAREEIEAAMESKETVYFNEEAECARDAVNEVLEMYDGLLRNLPENEKGAIQRAMGLKIEQLKAELEQLNE